MNKNKSKQAAKATLLAIFSPFNPAAVVPAAAPPKKAPAPLATDDRVWREPCGCMCTFFAPRFRAIRATLCSTHAPGGKLVREQLIDTARTRLGQAAAAAYLEANAGVS